MSIIFIFEMISCQGKYDLLLLSEMINNKVYNLIIDYRKGGMLENLDTILVTLFLLYWAYWITIAIIFRKRMDPFYVAFISPFTPIILVCEWLTTPVEKKQ